MRGARNARLTPSRFNGNSWEKPGAGSPIDRPKRAIRVHPHFLGFKEAIYLRLSDNFPVDFRARGRPERFCRHASANANEIVACAEQQAALFRACGS